MEEISWISNILLLEDQNKQAIFTDYMWRHGVVVFTTAQLHSNKPELRLCTGSNPAHGVSEIRDGEDH